jgi:dihydrofolate reductase
MRISIVVAASANNVIGRGGGLPWHITEDLQHFKKITMGHPIVMGRRTYESIGRPLPGRRNIVLTTQKAFAAEGCNIVDNPAAALRASGDADEVMIIGGGQVYDLFLPMTNRIYLTRVETHIEGDTFFPVLDDAEWRVTDETDYPANEQRLLGFKTQTIDRIAAPGPAFG